MKYTLNFILQTKTFPSHNSLNFKIKEKEKKEATCGISFLKVSRLDCGFYITYVKLAHLCSPSCFT